MSLKICSKGHEFYKTSDCPTCPTCEKEKKPTEKFLSLLGAPARRALEHAHIKSITDLSAYTEKEILAMHGMGPASLPQLKQSLSEHGLTFKKSEEVK